MAIKPELKQAVAYNKIKATDYNENFKKILDYVEDISEEFTLKVNTINSQLSSNVLSSLQSVYPVGSIYIGVTETCPIANLFGTWEKIEDGLVLQNSDSEHEIGTTIAAGLPNITGSFGCDGNNLDATGCFIQRTGTAHNVGGGTNDPGLMSFNASRSSSIYGKSSTVQPPAYVVNIWKRTA